MMTELQRALDQISDIRLQVAETKLFRGFGPAVIGATGILAMALGAAQAASLPHDGYTAAHLFQWIVLAGLSIMLIGGEMSALSKREHGLVAKTYLWAMMECSIGCCA